MPLSQGFFHYTGMRVFRLECSDLENIYKGDIDLGEKRIPIMIELMEKFVDLYEKTNGRYLRKTGEDAYEILLKSSIGERDFVLAINYVEEVGQVGKSSNLYYFAIDFIF